MAIAIIRLLRERASGYSYRGRAAQHVVHVRLNGAVPFPGRQTIKTERKRFSAHRQATGRKNCYANTQHHLPTLMHTSSTFPFPQLHSFHGLSPWRPNHTLTAERSSSNSTSIIWGPAGTHPLLLPSHPHSNGASIPTYCSRETSARSLLTTYSY